MKLQNSSTNEQWVVRPLWQEQWQRAAAPCLLTPSPPALPPPCTSTVAPAAPSFAPPELTGIFPARGGT